MISGTLREIIKPQEFLPKVLWFVMSLSIVIYLGVAYYLGLQQEPVMKSSGDVVETIKLIFPLIAIGNGIISIAIRKFMLSDSAVRKYLQKAPSKSLLKPTSTQDQQDSDYSRKRAMLSDKEQALASIAGSLFFTPFILGLVFNESIAVFGFVLALMIGSVEPMIPYAAAALLLNFWQYPRITVFVERAARL